MQTGSDAAGDKNQTSIFRLKCALPTAMGGVKKAVVTPVSNNMPPLPDLPFTVIVPRACCQSVNTLADAGAVCHWVEFGANSGSSLIMAKP
jgi:hypothetical protein